MAPRGPRVLVQKMAGIKRTDVLMVRVFISTRAARITLRARHTGFPSRSIRIIAANWTHAVSPISTIGFLRHDVSLGVDLLHHAVLIRQPANPACNKFLRQDLEPISNLVRFPRNRLAQFHTVPPARDPTMQATSASVMVQQFCHTL